MTTAALATLVHDLAADDRVVARTKEQDAAPVIDSADREALDVTLASITIQSNPAAYIALLAARSKCTQPDSATDLFSRFRAAMTDLAPTHANLLPHRFAQLCRNVSQLACQAGPAVALTMLAPLRSALEKSAPFTHHFTPVLADFLALCLMARAYDFARPFTEWRLVELDSDNIPTEATDVLLICYYKALVCIGLRDFHAALRHLALAFAVPGPVVTDVAVAAFKKYLLVSLLVTGKVAPLPRYSSVSQRRFQNYCTLYNDFVIAFSNLERGDLQKVVADGKHVFEKDENYGLVKQVVVAQKKMRIRRLTTHFCRLSLDELTKKAMLSSVAQAEQLLADMASAGEVRATIDQSIGMVSFDDSLGNGNVRSAGVDLALDNQMSACLSCLGRIVKFRDEVALHPWFIERELLDQDRRSRGQYIGDPDFKGDDEYIDQEDRPVMGRRM